MLLVKNFRSYTHSRVEFTLGETEVTEELQNLLRSMIICKKHAERLLKNSLLIKKKIPNQNLKLIH